MAVLELGIMRHNAKNPQKGQELIDWAMEHGVNHFEACWFYMNYECEPYLYSLLKRYNREDYFICGKMPIHNVLKNITPQELFTTQIERVPGHYFDTYLLQAADERVFLDIEQMKLIQYLQEQKEKGLIKRLGLSIQCLPGTFKKYLEMYKWDVVQMPINYYDWYLCRYDENYHLACDYNIPIIAQAPVKGGLLVKTSYFSETAYEQYGASLSDAAYSFVTSLPNIEMVLCGNSSLSTFSESYRSFNKTCIIPPDAYQAALDLYIKNASIPCIRCGRCNNVCSQHIPISSLFTLYNLGLHNKSYFNSLDILKSGLGEPSHVCKHCGACLSECPQHLNIPSLFTTHIFELRT